MSKSEQLEQEYLAANRASWKAKETLRKAEWAYHWASKKRNEAYEAFELERDKAAE